MTNCDTLRYNDEKNCTVCNAGYYFNEDGECTECDAGEGCFACDSRSPTVCLVCADGYY